MSDRMNLDKYIAALEAIRAEHGGDLFVGRILPNLRGAETSGTLPAWPPEVVDALGRDEHGEHTVPGKMVAI